MFVDLFIPRQIELPEYGVFGSTPLVWIFMTSVNNKTV